MQLIGSCKLRPVVTSHDVVVPVDERAGKEPADDYLITFIVPVVIVVAMLLLAAVAACFMYRRRRRSGKSLMNTKYFIYLYIKKYIFILNI